MAAATSAADALQKLIEQFNQSPSYTPKTAEQIRDQAQGEYKSYYDQLRLAAQQAQARNDLALQQQREGLQRTYDKQREASRKEYEDAYSRADRQMLSRGMQRSSYTAQVLANLTQEGAEAQQELWDQQGAAEGNVDAQRTQLAAQLADQLSQYSANEAADVLARIKELEDQEYDRGQSNAQYRNSLSAQIYQLMYQAERDKAADDQWQKEFDESVRQYENSRNGSGSGGSDRSENGDTDPGSTGGGTLQDFLRSMGIDSIPMPNLGTFTDRIKSIGGSSKVKSQISSALKKKNSQTSTGGGRFAQASLRD